MTTYNFVKDKGDELSAAGKNDDWATAFSQGYADIAFGNANSGICVDPTNAPTYNGDTVTAASGIAVYVAGLFGTGGVTPAVPASAGTYNSSSISFDLYHP